MFLLKMSIKILSLNTKEKKICLIKPHERIRAAAGGYSKISANEPYIGEGKVVDYSDGYYIIKYCNQIDKGSSYSISTKNNNLLLLYPINQKTPILEFYHTHPNNFALSDLDIRFWDKFNIPYWAVGWDKHIRGKVNLFPVINIHGY